MIPWAGHPGVILTSCNNDITRTHDSLMLMEKQQPKIETKSVKWELL